MPTIEKIVSGGQTGVDRAGLDAAMEAGILVGGYCPKGRLAEDGVVPYKYPLTEMASRSYTARTKKNVVESDGTLILNIGSLTGGTKKTAEYAGKHAKPFLVVPLDKLPSPETVIQWLDRHDILILNVAGPRESKFPQGIYQQSLLFLRAVLSEQKNETC
ncbi:MAG: putative molybdenum carrier protein [Desulfuromonadaceae bacterium]|nr:putative molybdenum carrier protein [Desulfuromonadaceae bacterium]